jgi:hypothetical protein
MSCTANRHKYLILFYLTSSLCQFLLTGFAVAASVVSSYSSCRRLHLAG